MLMSRPKSLSACKRFFSEATSAKHRQYEALRAYFVEERPSAEVARDFGYTAGSFQVLCHHFRREPDPVFFVSPHPGPRDQPKKSAARDLVVALRKRNYSVYDISRTLMEQKIELSPTAVNELLKAEGFARLPRRLDDERPYLLRPSIEPVADVRTFFMTPGKFTTQCGGLFLFVPDLVRLDLDSLARHARLSGSKMIPAGHALRSCLALKLFSIERKSNITALTADEGLALFAGLNAIPKRSYLSEYSSTVGRTHTTPLLEEWARRISRDGLLPGNSFNLDFHSVPYYGEHPLVERHYVSARSRRQKSILAFLAQDADGDAFCYSNADIRRGEENEEVMRFVSFWERTRGEKPKHLVFDSRLTTYANLDRLDEMGITFMTLRRRSKGLLKEVANLPRSAWRKVELKVPARKYRFPRVFEKKVVPAKREFRQLFIEDLGHDEPTILVTNDRKSSHAQIITRYARRMLIENALADAVRFFHSDALSSSVGLKVDFDMALLVMGSGLYRMLARRLRGYSDAWARTIFRDIISTPATVEIGGPGVTVTFHRRAHLPLIIDSGILERPVEVPWWKGCTLTLRSP